MAVILGFNAFHADSAVCLLIDGHLVGAVAEERLGERCKHSPAFPETAILHLLANAEQWLMAVRCEDGHING